jgi:hypothetical protein
VSSSAKRIPATAFAPKLLPTKFLYWRAGSMDPDLRLLCVAHDGCPRPALESLLDDAAPVVPRSARAQLDLRWLPYT